jgi:hypothetical protein
MRIPAAMRMIALTVAVVFCAQAGADDTLTGGTKPAAKRAVAERKAAPQAPSAHQTVVAAQSGTHKSNDTLVITARLIELPGTMPPNDLYNYVYMMKYRVIKVEKGSYAGQEILVGVYNPLIPRRQIADAMKKNATGDVAKFTVGDKHNLSLVTPIEKVWKDQMEDDYIDSDLPKYYAVRTDVAK